MFILTLFAALFSFGQNASATQCPNLNRAVNCRIPHYPVLRIDSVSQETNENNITTYMLNYPSRMGSGPKTLIIVADGKTHTFRDLRSDGRYIATCRDKTLTINIDYDANASIANFNSSRRAARQTFTEYQDNSIEMTLQSVDRGEKSPVFKGTCHKK